METQTLEVPEKHRLSTGEQPSLPEALPEDKLNLEVIGSQQQFMEVLRKRIGEPSWKGEQFLMDFSNIEMKTATTGIEGLTPTKLIVFMGSVGKSREDLEHLVDRKITRRDFLRIAASLGLGVTASTLVKPLEAIAAPGVERKLKSTVVEGIEIFGLEEKINDEKTLQMLYKQVEADYEQRGGKEKADPDMRYLELFVDRELYYRFEEGGVGTFTTWAKRHMEKLNEMMTTAIPPTDLKVALKRIVILDPSFGERVQSWEWSQFPQKEYRKGGSWNPNTLLPDVDGRWYLAYELRDRVAYYDYDWHYDRGLDHEFGHYLLGLEDLYKLDYWFLSDKIKGIIPDNIRTYRAGRYLMSNCDFGIDTYSALVLEYMRKKGIVGRDRKAYERFVKISSLYYELLPETTHLVLKYPDGRPMAGCSYQLIALPKDTGYGNYNEDRLSILTKGELNEKGIFDLKKEIFSIDWAGPDPDEGYHRILTVKTPEGKTYSQVLTPIPFSVLYLSGQESEANLSIEFKDFQEYGGIKIIDEKGNPLYLDGKVFHYEDVRGEPMKDKKGEPILCSFGELGVGVYRLKDIEKDGYRMKSVKAMWSDYKYNNYPMPYPPRIWYRGGVSQWFFESGKNISQENPNGQVQSVMPLPYKQALVHRFMPGTVVVRKDKEGNDNFNGGTWRGFEILVEKF